MYTNTRRAAAAKLQPLQTSTASATSGSDERKVLEKTLTPVQKTILQLFKVPDGRTETDVYLVFACRLDYKRARLCLETDTPPQMIVEGVVPLDKLRYDEFYIPAVALNTPEWAASKPRFGKWLISTSRYPACDDKAKTAIRNSSTKEVSDLEWVEIYFSTLFATLEEFFATGEVKYAENAWKITWTINHILDHLRDKAKTDLAGLLKNIEQLKTLIMNRDKSVDDAEKYRKFVNDLPPAHYYWMLYQLMVESPEVVHKSHLTSLNTFILGLMTQPALGDLGCTLSGIQDSLVRMIFERAMKWIGTQNLSNFIQKEEIVEAIHKNSGKGVENAFRYWASMIETVRTVLLPRQFTQHEFTAQLEIIRKGMKDLRGITTFVLIISPETERYLNDEVIAEFILAMGKADKKFTVFSTSAINSKTQTPLIDEVLKANVERAQKLQAELAAPAAVKEDEEMTMWEYFLETVGHTVETANQVHTDSHHSYKREIAKLAKRGDAQSLKSLQQLLEGGYQVNPALLGPRRARALVLRATDLGSEVYTHFIGDLRPRDFEHLSESLPRDSVGTMLQDLTRDLTKATPLPKKKPAEKPDAVDVSPIEFLKFELARELVQKTKIAMSKEIEEVLHDCFICFEEVVSRKMIVLHNDTRHSVCSTCRPQLSSCPFCRADI